MITIQKVERQMGKTTLIKFDNGIFVEQKFGNLVVGKVEYAQLKWVDLFTNLSKNDQELLYKMLKARDVINGFDRLFHNQNEK